MRWHPNDSEKPTSSQHGGHLMEYKIIKSTLFFQDLLSSYFRRMRQQVVETLLLLCVCHLFGLYNPNQVADALKLPKARLYRSLGSLSLYHSKCLKSPTRMCDGRRFHQRHGKLKVLQRNPGGVSPSVSMIQIYHARQRRCLIVQTTTRKAHNTAIFCQNVLGITLKCGDHVLPLDMRLVSKQGRGNTDKPTLVISMLKEVLAFFDTHGIDLRKYPITFDSWYAGRKLVDALSALGFTSTLVHGKNNFVMTIGETKAKLSVHKKHIDLREDEWGCDKTRLPCQSNKSNIW